MDPYDAMQHYHPGDGAQSWAVTTTPSSTPVELTDGWWYELSATVPVYAKLAALTTAVSTATQAREYLRADEWSLSFQARTDEVLGVKAASGSGTAYLRRVGFGAR